MSDESGLIVELGNFHETMLGFTIDQNGRTAVAEGYPDSEFVIAIQDSGRFSLSINREVDFEFKYVRDMVRLVSASLMKGEYSDSNGHPYRFSDTLLTVPSGENYAYWVEFDCYGGPPPCDLISINGTAYHFSFSSDTLKISEFYGEDNTEIREQPKWILVKRKAHATSGSM